MEPAKALSGRCAIYTRKSSEEGLERDFNSRDCRVNVQRAAPEADWRVLHTHRSGIEDHRATERRDQHACRLACMDVTQGTILALLKTASDNARNVHSGHVQGQRVDAIGRTS